MANARLGFNRRKTALLLLVVVAATFTFVAALGGGAGGSGGYSANLVSPAVPGASDTYTWTISGSKPGPGEEISHLLIYGCWRASGSLPSTPW